MLRLDGVWAGYDAGTVLRDVALVAPAGAVTALLGPNGAGKTTLLRAASGLLPLQRGRMLLDGVDVTGYSAERLARAGICHVPEGRGVIPGMSVRENLLLFAPPGAESEAIEAATEAFPVLGKRLSQAAGTMSGGEQQMLALSRAYLRRPPLILLDEVSFGLAPKIVDEIFLFLDRLVAQGSALLIVEQFVTKALELADYAYLLNRGQVVFAGDKAELQNEDIFARYLGVAS